MNTKQGTSRYKRLYGKTIVELAKELGFSIPKVSIMHHAGALDHLQIEGARDIHQLHGNLYRVLRNINHRCNNKSDKKFRYYGGKGIKNFMSFSDVFYLWMRDRAELMQQPSIDRIDPAGHYTIENCRFIETRENRKRKYK